MFDDDIMTDFLSAAAEDQQDRFNRMIGKEDWMLREVPPIPEHLFGEFMSVIGEENIYWLHRMQIQTGGGVVNRGQAMFSPTAEQNALQWLADNPRR